MSATEDEFGIDVGRCHYCGIPLVPKGRLAEFCEYHSWSRAYVIPAGMAMETADHKVPRSRGGSNDPANLVPACPRCNSRKGTKPYFEFLWSII